MLTGANSPTPDSAARASGAPLRLLELPPGQMLVREGDPPGAVYVIRTGGLRVYKNDPSADNGTLELASLGAGAIIGELGTILGRPRSASVQAVEVTQVLEIPADQLPSFVRQHRPLLRVIATALRERTELSEVEILELSEKLRVAMPHEAASIKQPAPRRASANNGRAAPQTTVRLSVQAYDPTLVYPKRVDCPSCGTQFSALMVHPRKDRPAKRESDFHNIYATAHNPYDYELWVCPNDLYAALPADFANLAEKYRQHVAPVVEEVSSGWGANMPDFDADRTLELRERGLELALGLYTMRKMPLIRIAAIAHRLAWCARERADPQTEKAWLARALDYYRTAYSEENLGGAKDELRVQYLCGELTLRLGDLDGAVFWFDQALRHPGLMDNANWERLLRERWAGARAAVARPDNTS